MFLKVNTYMQFKGASSFFIIRIYTDVFPKSVQVFPCMIPVGIYQCITMLIIHAKHAFLKLVSDAADENATFFGNNM